MTGENFKTIVKGLTFLCLVLVIAYSAFTSGCEKKTTTEDPIETLARELEKPSSYKPFKIEDNPQHQKLLKMFQDHREPKVLDAIWTEKDIFKVGVKNDGSSRDGYAEYVCQVLYDNGFKGQKVWVQVIDYGKLTGIGHEWVKLGEAQCK